MAKLKIVHLTDDIKSWSEPKGKLLKILKRLEQHYNKEVIVWGGGGWGSSTAILKRVEIQPTILNDHDGYTLRAYLDRVNPPISPYAKNKNEWTPWLGSWQISVKATKQKLAQVV